MSFSLYYVSEARVETVHGPRLLKKARPDGAFWQTWRQGKTQLAELGYVVTKEAGEFWVHYYAPLPGKAATPQERAPFALSDPRHLYAYQAASAGVQAGALLSQGAALDGSDTGTGKTRVNLSVVKNLGLSFAVICPHRAFPSWEAHCRLFGLSPLFIVNWEFARGKNFRFGVWRDKWTYQWKIPKDTCLIFDEVHHAKGEYTKNAKILIAASQQKFPLLLLSATAASHPREMRAIGYALGLHTLDNFDSWSQKYGSFQNDKGYWESTDTVDAMKKMSTEIYPLRGTRIRIQELGDAFPETQITSETYALSPSKTEEQNEAYQKLLDQVGALNREIKRLEKAVEILKAEASPDWEEAGKQLRSLRAKKLTLHLRYRQLTEILKVDLLSEMAEEGLASGHSVIIFCNFTETLHQLAKKLKTDCLIAGADVQPTEATFEAMRDFQADVKRIVICNIASGGAAIDLHDVRGEFPRLSLIPPTYNPVHLKQALGRPWRADAKSKSLQRLVYAAGTVEEGVCQKVALRIDSIAALNDGDLMEEDIFKLKLSLEEKE